MTVWGKGGNERCVVRDNTFVSAVLDSEICGSQERMRGLICLEMRVGSHQHAFVTQFQ